MKFSIRDLLLVTVIVAVGRLATIAEETPKPKFVKEPELRSELLARTKVDQEARKAWLLVQHADADVKFQRRCLDLMARLPKGEVSISNLAYLTDRVLLAEGKKQLYGTQFTSVDGKWQPGPSKTKPMLTSAVHKLACRHWPTTPI